MLYNSTGFEKIYVACGYTDLRRGIDGLASVVQHTFNLDPFQKNVLFMFCGRKNNRIKCLLWEGDGFVLLYKRLEDGRFQWPRTQEEVAQITQDEFQMLSKRNQESRACQMRTKAVVCLHSFVSICADA